MSHSIFGLLAQQSGGGSPFGSLLIFAPVFLLLYLLMIRPQRRRTREAAELQAKLGVGDEVITTSGIYGFITGVEDDLFWLEIDNDVQIRIAKAAVSGKAPTASDDASATKATKAVGNGGDSTKGSAAKSPKTTSGSGGAKSDDSGEQSDTNSGSLIKKASMFWDNRK